jgi:hypothetical protein
LNEANDGLVDNETNATVSAEPQLCICCEFKKICVRVLGERLSNHSFSYFIL